MKNRHIVVVAIGLVLLAFAAAIYLQISSRETKDRLSPQIMAQMVEGPMSVVRERGLAAGEAEFEQLLAVEVARHGSNSVRVADLYMAFGVELHAEWIATGDPALLQAARDRVWTAIPRYRAAFGPAHPEVAVALHSFAMVELQLHEGRSSPQAETALREAARIRRAALGPENPETLAAEAQLKSIGASEN